jgi:hypothetical protein
VDGILGSLGTRIGMMADLLCAGLFGILDVEGLMEA